MLLNEKKQLFLSYINKERDDETVQKQSNLVLGHIDVLLCFNRL